MVRFSLKLAAGSLFAAIAGLGGFAFSVYKYEADKDYSKVSEADRLNEKTQLEIEIHEFKKIWKDKGKEVRMNLKKVGEEFKKNIEVQEMEMPKEGQVILNIINDTQKE